MKQKLEITKEEAIKLYAEASDALKSIFESTFGVDTFKPKKITDKIQNIDDVLEALGEFSFTQYRNTPSREERSIHAFNMLLKVVKVYNEGWVPDWNNSNQYKYYPYFYKSSDGSWSVDCNLWFSYCDCPSGLIFKSSELALDAIKKFESLYKDYYMVS